MLAKRNRDPRQIRRLSALAAVYDGTRPRLPADQRYQSAYLFGAICPRLGKGASLMLPSANTHAM